MNPAGCGVAAGGFLLWERHPLCGPRRPPRALWELPVRTDAVASFLEVIGVASAFASGRTAATAVSAQAGSVGRSVQFFKDMALLDPDTSLSLVLALRWGHR